VRKLAIYGGKPLKGELKVQGAKNAALPILAATLLTDEVCEIKNCPDLSDVHAAIEILQSLGARVFYDGKTARVSAAGVKCCEICEKLTLKMRSSVMFLGPMLSRCGKASIGYPGGCALGARPINLHISALSRLGAEIRETEDGIQAGVLRFRPETITLPFPSVGATENLLMFCAVSKGETVIFHPAKEPEIVDLQNFLNAMGADIRGAGSEVIRIQGVQRLHGASYTVMPDRIAAATYACGVAACGGEVLLRDARADHLTTFLSTLGQMGVRTESLPNSILVSMQQRPFGAGRIQTQPYPGFPTDIQPLMMAAVLKGKGTTAFAETIFENRFRHVEEFIRMGANITMENQTAFVTGVDTLSGTKLHAADLRGGAALALAALSAEGRSELDGLCYIERGYEQFAQTIQTLGGDVEVIYD